jgi:hypothetical protein
VPIETGIWRIDNGVSRINTVRMENETKLEEVLLKDIDILGLDLMVIGRQVITAYGKRIDILAINSDGHLYVIEIKRDRTPREVVAQLLDYGSWVKHLTYQDVVNIYEGNKAKLALTKKFEEEFYDKFGKNAPESLNESHQLVIVASELDSSSERIVSYLSEDYGVPINAVFFSYFKDGEAEYLSRTWLIDPNEIVVSAPVRSKEEKWNGQDFYVSLGEDTGYRNWDDCVKYGYISGGQGKWYSKTLHQLFPGARIFAYIPNKGYVGVGVVEETAVMIKDFTIEIDGEKKPLLTLDLLAPKANENSDDPDLSEYAVKVKWIKTLSREEAIWQKGMFANQNTACKLKNRFTLDILIKEFNLED